MAIDGSDTTREVRLEGGKLLVGVVGLGGIVLAAVVGAFLLGRWVESRSRPAGSTGAGGGDPLGAVVRAAPDAEVTDELTYFDRLQGTEQRPEPAREATRATPPPPSPPGGGAREEGGAYFVQVFAGRDRSSAEELVGRLEGQGLPVHLDSEPDGGGLLYKVRVGGYPTKERAGEVAQGLTRGGFSAWVTSRR
jgi:hypothetical protein